MDVTNYDYALWKMGRTDQDIGRIGNAHWPKLVHLQRHYCHACVDKEIQERGFAYTHRSQQIIGAFVCHVHRERLSPLDIANSDNLAAHGFLAHSAIGRDATWRLAAPVCHKPISVFHHRLAQFIRAALDSELPRISYELRHSIIAHKSKIYAAGGRYGLGQLDALQRLVDESFSAAFLREIGAEFLSELHRHVSHIALGHPHFVENPMANLAMLSVLFETPRQFVREIEQHLPKGVGDSSATVNGDPVPPTFGLARDLLHTAQVTQVSRKYGIDMVNMKNYLAMRPSFANRRHLAIARSKLRNARLALLRFLTTHPDGRRNDFRLSDLSNYYWLSRYDVECLNDLLPV